MNDIEAVIFDYGLVLSGPQNLAAIEQACAITCLDRARFEALYWARRDAYDRGVLTGYEYWHEIVQTAGITPEPALIQRLIELDGRIWLTENAPMLLWQAGLNARGIRSAILSNMGDAVQQQIELHCSWIGRFEACVWSNTVRLTKPDPRIYEHALRLLGVPASRTLFIDDRMENVRAARAAGMLALQYTSFTAWQRELADLAPVLLS
jgi:putative hydrolase of the HAD superfamily